MLNSSIFICEAVSPAADPWVLLPPGPVIIGSTSSRSLILTIKGWTDTFPEESVAFKTTLYLLSLPVSVAFS